MIHRILEIHPSYITLNGQTTEVEQLIEGREKVTGWERDWLDFLAEWYHPANFIEVKTSGSTGEPKTIRLGKDFVAASAWRTIQFFKLKEGDKILHCLPSRYIAGKLMVVRALIGKLDLHVVDPSTDFEFLTSNIQFKFAAMVINQIDKCLGFGIPNLDFLLLGGSAIPAELETKLQSVKTQCYSSYAMTETATHIALRQINGKGKTLWYRCLDGISVGLDERSCLCIDMPGLKDRPLQTNDLAELKDGETFRILGRIDNRIISGGLKFSPEELEQKLGGAIKLPFYISAKPHDKLGQQLILVVEGIKSDSLISEIETACKLHLSRYEQPREIIFVERLPRTGNGKLKR